MYRIAHISDSHISFNDENGHGKRLVELLTDIKKRDCSHIVLTGDLSDNPDIKDLQLVREIFSKFDLLDHTKLSVIPGNHDIFGGAPQGVDFFRFPMICKEENYNENVDRFINAFKETFSGNGTFPFLKIIGNIAFIGINSIDIWSELKNPEGSNGRVYDKEFKKIEKILSSKKIKDKYKIVMIHHHFLNVADENEYPAHSLWIKVVNWKMKLFGRKRLSELFKKNKVNLVLHGHTHINQIYNIRQVTYVNSSASCVPITDDQLRRYNIINIPDEADQEKSITVETIEV